MRGVCAVTKSVYKAVAQQQQCTTQTVFQALAFVPVGHGVCVRVVGAQQEIEPRQRFRIQCNNQTHIVRSHTRYDIRSIQRSSKSGSSYISWERLSSPFRLETPRGYQVNPTHPFPKGNLVSCKTLGWTAYFVRFFRIFVNDSIRFFESCQRLRPVFPESMNQSVRFFCL